MVSSMTSDMSFKLPSSMPLVATTSVVVGPKRWRELLRDGSEMRRRWHQDHVLGAGDAAATSDEARSGLRQRNVGKVDRVAVSRVDLVRDLGSSAHIMTECPRRAACAASAVPHAPEPTTAKFAMRPPYTSSLRASCTRRGIAPRARRI
jgi:hypothetical protein